MKSFRSNGRRVPGRRFGVVVASLLSVAIVVMATAGLFALERTEPEAVAKPASTTVSASDIADKRSPVLIPYSTTIGFVGDSLTYGCCNDSTPAPTIEVNSLGDNYRAINRGVNGATTRDWVNQLLNPAIEEFVANQVEIVQVMLGTNDVAQNIPVDESMDNLRQIADRLLDNGVKVVIINKIPYSTKHDDMAIRRYNVALDELADGQGIYLGDDQAYTYFRDHQDRLYDGIHMDQNGYAELADLWVDAFKRIVVEPSQTTHGLSSEVYNRGASQALIYSIDKPAKWFVASLNCSGITIDNNKLTPDDYDIVGADDTTMVRLHSEYLDGLADGEHYITITFADGTSFSNDFDIAVASDK